MVNDTAVIHSGSDADDTAGRLRAVRELAGDWLTLAEVGELTGRSLNQCRRMLSDKEVIGLRVGPGGPRVPAAFFEEGEPLPALRGTIVVLEDGGMSDLEAVEWLFTPDESLPVPGTPVENLRSGFKTEIRRRAMELAF